MSRNVLLSASALLLATSAAHALDLKSGLSVQAPGVTVQSSAEANVKTPTVQSTKDAAIKAGQSSRDAGIAAGVGALTTGKSAVDSGKAVGQAAYGNAKAEAQANAAAAKEAGLAKAAAAKEAAMAKAGAAEGHATGAIGHGKHIAAGYKQDAAKAISVKDRAAAAKFAATQKAGGTVTKKLFGLFGGSAPAAAAPAAGYESKLVIGAKLDADLGANAVKLNSSTVAGLGTQPSGTQLLLVGDHVVRVDSKTNVVLDASSTASL